MLDPNSVNWNLLPHDPVRFFELSSQYDLVELKEKYSQYIKLFKPDLFPDEFRKIRAAFEFLKGNIENPKPSYRKFTNQIPTQTFGSISSDEETSDSDEDSPWRDPLRIRVDPDSPSDPQEQARVFYISAVNALGDSPYGFLDGLLDGLYKFPSNPILRRLLWMELRMPIPPEQVPEYLIRVAKWSKTGEFFSFTFDLWILALRELRHSRVLSVFDRCEAHLSGDLKNQKTHFLSRLLTLCSGGYDPDTSEFLLMAYTYLNSQYRQLDYRLNQELMFCDELLELKQHKGKVDSNLEKVFETLLGGWKGNYINWLVQIARVNLEIALLHDGMTVSKAAPELKHRILRLWERVSDKAAQFLSLEYRTTDLENLNKIFDSVLRPHASRVAKALGSPYEQIRPVLYSLATVNIPLFQFFDLLRDQLNILFRESFSKSLIDEAMKDLDLLLFVVAQRFAI